MKILQISAYYPPRIGGLQKCVQEIAERLATETHTVEVFTSNIGSNTSRPYSTPNLHIHYLKGYQFAHTAIIPSLFFKLIKYDNHSIIHLHIAHAFIPEIVLLVSKLRNIPYIAHVHADIEPTGKLGFLVPIYKQWFLKPVLKSASKIIVLNRKYKQILKNKYGLSNNVIVVPNGVSDEFFVNKNPTQHRLIHLLYIGRLSPEKNVSILVKAVSLLKSKVILDIVGDGENRTDIEHLISKYSLKNVYLHGNKTGKDLIDFYKNADIFLLASDHEGLPLVLLESMASGTPIIASDVIGIRDLVRDTGILIKPITSEKFAEAIEYLSTNKKFRDKYSLAGIQKAKTYSWKYIIKQLEDIYQDVSSEA